ncbi:MAG TPA: radical SAM protein, partial [Acidimicrobiia bacterium]
MARIVLTDVSVIVNSVDLSDHIAQVELNTTFDEIETTAFGDGGRTRVAGLEDSSLTLAFHQDFADSSVDATIQPLVGGTAPFQIVPAGT